MEKATALLMFVAATASAQYNLEECRPAKLVPSIDLASKGERGTPLVVSGRVLDEGGKPVANAYVRAFQADAAGVYTTDRTQRPRLCGVARTGNDGRYRFVTIRPASYPSTREPAHIHFEIWSANGKVQRARLEFADDPFAKNREHVRKVTKDANGAQVVERDLVLR